MKIRPKSLTPLIQTHKNNTKIVVWIGFEATEPVEFTISGADPAADLYYRDDKYIGMCPKQCLTVCTLQSRILNINNLLEIMLLVSKCI